MSRAKSLIFLSFTNTLNDYTFSYNVDEVTYDIHLAHSTPSELDEKTRTTILFNLGMCYLLDIAEITIPETIHVAFALSELQLEFWRTLYQEVAVEKMYVNGLDLNLLKAVWSSDSQRETFPKISLPPNRTKVGLCLTGGKESLMLLKLLKNKVDLQPFFLNPETSVHRQKVYDRVKTEFTTVRTISDRPVVLKEIKKRYESDIECGVDMAHLVFNNMLLNTKYVLIGNEYSANFPNFLYQGYMVNHQYIKSIPFAQKLNAYIHAYITKDYTYYSPFSHLYEYKIASKLFVDDEYLEVWTSCNKTTPTVNFCSHCHKCAFTYLISALYTTEEHLSTFFSRDMLQDVELYKDLMDFTGKKPLDCVGEKNEVWVALEKLSAISNFAQKPVITYYKTNIRPFIEKDLQAFTSEVESLQKVPTTLPSEIQQIIDAAFNTE